MRQTQWHVKVKLCQGNAYAYVTHTRTLILTHPHTHTCTDTPTHNTKAHQVSLQQGNAYTYTIHTHLCTYSRAQKSLLQGLVSGCGAELLALLRPPLLRLPLHTSVTAARVAAAVAAAAVVGAALSVAVCISRVRVAAAVCFRSDSPVCLSVRGSALLSCRFSCIRQHTSTYVSLRQHTSASVVSE